jgi:heme/copper-type cytochrome/quinol oxidase subunit 1
MFLKWQNIRADLESLFCPTPILDVHISSAISIVAKFHFILFIAISFSCRTGVNFLGILGRLEAPIEV